MQEHRHTGVIASQGGSVSRDETDMARASTYLLLATLLRTEPTERLLADLSRLDTDDTPLGRARAELAKAAAQTTAHDVAREYQAVFIGVGRGEVLPYGSYYLTGFLNERPLARVRREMKALGIARADGVFEPEDHLGSLCEVMAALISGTIDQPLTAADQFFTKHLAPWAPRTWDDIIAAPSARFYKAVGAFGRLWFDIEAAALAVDTAPPRVATTTH